MNILKRKTSVVAMFVLFVAMCAAFSVVLSGCNESSSPLPTDSKSWVLDNITVTSGSEVKTYSVAAAEKIKEDYPVSEENSEEVNEANRAKWIVYDGMYLGAGTVSVTFAGEYVYLDFADGRSEEGTWKKSGESFGTSMIEYVFGRSEATYGTCGRVEEQDGTRHLLLYVVCGKETFVFSAAL